MFQTTSNAHARILAKELGPPVDEHDVTGLRAWQVLARLAAGGAAMHAVSGRTAPPPEPTGFAHSAVQRSRLQYARRLEEVLAQRAPAQQDTAAALARLPRLD